MGAPPLSSAGVGLPAHTCDTPQASAKAPHRNRSMLTLINGASFDASC
jgi:hypothetical protein